MDSLFLVRHLRSANNVSQKLNAQYSLCICQSISISLETFESATLKLPTSSVAVVRIVFNETLTVKWGWEHIIDLEEL